MSLAIERTVRARNQDGTLSEPMPLANYKGTQAWVLLGDPGSGKTKTFEALAATHGHTPITARDFIELEPQSGGYPTPIFIDGLDEYTASTSEGFTAIGRIRSRLQALGTPPFRISCREADWRGSTDSSALQRLVGESKFAELHLEQLNETQILAFVMYWQNSSPEAATAYIKKARQQDLDGLLRNPQTLRMLIQSVSSSAQDWPKSKSETYAKACASLIREQNDEHLDSKINTTLTDTQVLQAAGYLSAAMLLAGSTAIATKQNKNPRTHSVELTALLANTHYSPSLVACQAALKTHLFSGNGLGDFVPVHRTVAEYLGAIYLAERIRAHLPASRVLALIEGEDGGVVPELRGLHAWLAVVTNESVRRDLIERDPLGLVLNGDVSLFSRKEKLHVLKALRQEAERYAYFRNQNWTSNPFGALASADMQEDFRALLESKDRSLAHQAIVDCLLNALTHGQAMPDLQEVIERIVYDKTYSPPYRMEALKICLRYAAESNTWSSMIALLENVKRGGIEDTEDELLGTLLLHLYPGHIPPEKIWDYYRKPKSDRFIGRYRLFWKSLAKDRAPESDLPLLLDALLASGIKLKHGFEERAISDTVGSLLSAGIAVHGDSIAIPHLYQWLSIGVGPHSSNALQPEHKAKIARWLADHPAIYKALFEYGINVVAQTTELVHMWFYDLATIFCGAKPPEDAAQWYLLLAAQRTDPFRRQLVQEAFSLTHQRKNGNSALILIEQWCALHPVDEKWVSENLLTCNYPPESWQQEHIDYEIKYQRRQEEESKQKIQFFRENLPEFITGTAHLGALNVVAETYLNFFSDSPQENPKIRLLELLNNDPHWVEMALVGLRNCLFRADLPSADDVLALHFKSQRFHLATPCLAAMELRYAEDPDTTLNLATHILETVIAFRLTNNYGNTPIWFKNLIVHLAPLVAKVMQPLLRHDIAQTPQNVTGLYALAHEAEYAVIAQLVIPTLIANAPIRASKKQQGNIALLVVALVHQLDHETQLTLIDSKLKQSPMDIAQRVYWLTAGTQIAPQLYLETLRDYVGTTQARASHVFALLQAQRQEDKAFDALTTPAKQYFIELLGKRFTPEKNPRNGGAHWVTSAMESTRYVQQLIASLGANPSEEAHKALAALAQNPALKTWEAHFQQAAYDQQIIRRKALFQHASVIEVCKTLANLQPANVADLHALVVDHLTQLAHAIRHGKSDIYDHYWNGETPKLENDCRNILLTHLEGRLNPIGIAAEQEGTYADQKRADIKVLYGALQIPIEIKRDSHKDIWKAIHEQLIAKYSREHASDGYGVYIVFWFHKDPMPVAGDGGNKPKTPQELQQRLAATVPKELKNKITVLVIDCSKPLQK